MVELSTFRALRFGAGAPRVSGSNRVDVSPLVRTDPDGGYAGAASVFTAWQRRGLLSADSRARLWLLEITSGDGDVQHGLVGELTLDDRVLAHERTQPELVAERAARLRALPADLSPISVYTERTVESIDAHTERRRSAVPDIDVVDENGGRFRMWAVDDTAPIIDALQPLRAVVADGHHRVAAARAVVFAAGPPRTLGFVIPHPPRNRAVHRLLSAPKRSALVEQLAGFFAITPTPADRLPQNLDATPGTAFGLYLSTRESFLLVPHDLAMLQQGLPRTGSVKWRNLDQVVWTHSVEPALQGVSATPLSDLDSAVRDLDASSEPFVAVLVLRSVATETVTALALRSEPLPAKVTWFYPKPRTGLLVRSAT